MTIRPFSTSDNDRNHAIIDHNLLKTLSIRPRNPFAAARKPREIAEGVTLLGSKRVNFYAITEGRSVTLVDCGFYGHLRYLQEWLSATGRRMSDIEAVVITHADGDHLGFASIFGPLGIPVLIASPDLADAHNKQRVPVRQIVRNVWRPACLGLYLESMGDSVSRQPPVSNAKAFNPGNQLDIPGRPTTVHVPGHSPGNCSLFLADKNILLGGDSLMTLNIFTGKRGVWAFNPYNAEFDSQAIDSLSALTPFSSAALLPGHGEPWMEEGAVGRALQEVRLG